MKIQVRYFAILRERLKSDGEMLELSSETTVEGALAHLAEKHPLIGEMANRFQTAVNQEMVPRSTGLNDGDELVLIPPVAGGADARARILDTPLSLDRVIDQVRGPEMGGLVTFTGMVRKQNRGHDIEHLEYEAYAEMAEKVMLELIAEIEAEIPTTRLAVEHRVGSLAIGDLAVVIAAASPHRAEAFSACRAMIDRLKERTPIWKKEFSTSGAEWIDEHP